VSQQDPVFEFFRSINIIQSLSQARVEQALPGEMLLSHFGVLNHLSVPDREPTPAELADSFQVKRPSMTNTINKLERMGFVRVRPDPTDGRSKRVSITTAGVKAHLAARNAMPPVFRDLVDEFGVEAFVALLPQLQAIKQFLDTHRK